MASGLVVGGCRLESVLGRGGMGTVYRARQIALGREVAVKLVPATGVDDRLIARFRREAQAAAAVDHPNLVPIYAAGEEQGLLYLVMRLIDGVDLRTLVAREGPLAPPRAAVLIEQVAAALDAVHAAGLVHRDVKPANVLVERRGNAERAFLSDFGLMRRALGDPAITDTGEWVGTADYMAPEQLESRPIDSRADVYALAGVLYTAMSGRPPFPRDSLAATAWAHANAPVPRLGSGRLDPVIAHGMAKAPADRFRTAGELARAARTAVTSPRRRRRTAVAALVLVACAAASAALVLSLHRGSNRSVNQSAFRFRYPSGWRVVENELPQGGFVRTQVINPEGTEMVIIDRTPGEALSIGAWATSVERATAAQTAGYRRVSIQPATVGGRSAVVWTFVVPGAPSPARVDVFQRLGTSGYAVLGKGGTMKEIAPLTLSVARSLRTR